MNPLLVIFLFVSLLHRGGAQCGPGGFTEWPGAVEDSLINPNIPTGTACYTTIGQVGIQSEIEEACTDLGGELAQIDIAMFSDVSNRLGLDGSQYWTSAMLDGNYFSWPEGNNVQNADDTSVAPAFRFESCLTYDVSTASFVPQICNCNERQYDAICVRQEFTTFFITAGSTGSVQVSPFIGNPETASSLGPKVDLTVTFDGDFPTVVIPADPGYLFIENTFVEGQSVTFTIDADRVQQPLTRTTVISRNPATNQTIHSSGGLDIDIYYDLYVQVIDDDAADDPPYDGATVTGLDGAGNVLQTLVTDSTGMVNLNRLVYQIGQAYEVQVSVPDNDDISCFRFSTTGNVMFSDEGTIIVTSDCFENT